MVLDCLNAGSIGVPWFWPFSSTFFDLPTDPIPAVIEVKDFFTWHGVRIVALETLIFLPFFVYGLFGRRRRAALSARRESLGEL
jgi:hypothetical protein